MPENYDCLIKLLLIGDSGVGKSCLLVRLSEGSFCSTHITTIGIDFKVKFLEIDGLRVKLQIWDTAGQERFRTITQAYYRSAMGVLIVYDHSNIESFNNARSWLEQIAVHAAPDIDKMVVANKSDIPSAVPEGEGQQLADEFGLEWRLASAKTGDGVNEAFEQLTKQIITRLKAEAAKNALSDNGLANSGHADASVVTLSGTPAQGRDAFWLDQQKSSRTCQC